MPSPGSRKRDRQTMPPHPFFGGCLTYIACVTALIGLSVAAGFVGFTLLVWLGVTQGPAIVMSVGVMIVVALFLNWLLRRQLGHSITDFLHLFDLF